MIKTAMISKYSSNEFSKSLSDKLEDISKEYEVIDIKYSSFFDNNIRKPMYTGIIMYEDNTEASIVDLNETTHHSCCCQEDYQDNSGVSIVEDDTNDDSITIDGGE